jgi:hypothetical protein
VPPRCRKTVAAAVPMVPLLTDSVMDIVATVAGLTSPRSPRNGTVGTLIDVSGPTVALVNVIDGLGAWTSSTAKGGWGYWSNLTIQLGPSWPGGPPRLMVSPDKVSYEIVGLPCAIVSVSPAIGAPPGDHVPGMSMLYVPLAIQVLAVMVALLSDDDVDDRRADGDQAAGHGRRDDVGPQLSSPVSTAAEWRSPALDAVGWTTAGDDLDEFRPASAANRAERKRGAYGKKLPLPGWKPNTETEH